MLDKKLKILLDNILQNQISINFGHYWLYQLHYQLILLTQLQKGMQLGVTFINVNIYLFLLCYLASLSTKSYDRLLSRKKGVDSHQQLVS